MAGKAKRNYALLIFLLVLGLVGFGLLSIYNASSFDAFQTFGNKYYYVQNQAIWALAGFAALLFFSFFPYQKLKAYLLAIFMVNLFGLAAVLIPGIGTQIMGARRWLYLGFFSIQPSEFLKPVLAVYLASWLETKRNMFVFLAVVFLLVGLIMLQPDLGTALVIALTAFGIYFISGAGIGKMLLIGFVGVLLASLAIFTSQYRTARVLTFLNPQADPLGRSWHIRQALLALGSGGFFGTGLGQGRAKYQYLPEATTDSIFAVIGEELGFVGATCLIVAYLFFIYLGLKVAARASDKFGILLASGLTLWIGFQALINFSAMVSLVPLTGIPLPFVSYGGSSLLVSLISAGIIINIGRKGAR